MAKRVVDLLELVEIDEQQRRHLAGIALNVSRRSISARKLTRLGARSGRRNAPDG